MFSDLEKILPMAEELIKQLKILNENLSDIKEMIAPYLGFVVKDEKEKRQNGGS